MRYFFNSADDRYERDEEGQELPDHDTARLRAVEHACKLLREHPNVVWKGSNFRVDVTDRAGLLYFTIIIVGVDSSAALVRSS